MKNLALICLLLFLTFNATPSQQLHNKHLHYANSLLNTGDYLFASQLFKLVSETATDSNLIAEALYKFKECGDKAAELFLTKLQYKEEFYLNNQGKLWETKLQPLFDEQIENFKKLDIEISCGKHFNLICFNKNDTTLQRLSTEFANTKWGELAAYELITFGHIDYIDTTPQTVISKSKLFLVNYPETQYRYKVYNLIARAYSDLWNFSLSKDHRESLTNEEITNADKHRILALDYYQKIIEYNKNSSKKVKIPFGNRSVKRLKDKMHTGVYSFYND